MLFRAIDPGEPFVVKNATIAPTERQDNPTRPDEGSVRQKYSALRTQPHIEGWVIIIVKYGRSTESNLSRGCLGLVLPLPKAAHGCALSKEGRIWEIHLGGNLRLSRPFWLSSAIVHLYGMACWTRRESEDRTCSMGSLAPSDEYITSPARGPSRSAPAGDTGTRECSREILSEISRDHELRVSGLRAFFASTGSARLSQRLFMA